MEANGVFVHLFRNKEAWKQNEGLIETAKGKFEAEQEYRKKLAAAAGLTEEQAKLKFNYHIDPSLFYPPGIPSEILHKSFRLPDDRKPGDYAVWWPGLNANGNSYSCYIPTEVLEEAKLVQQHEMFEKLYIDFSRWDGLGSSVLEGTIRGGKYCLIAYWGSKEVHDNIQKQLAELQKSKAEAEAAKLKEEQAKANKEENSATRKWSVKDRIIAAVAILALIGSITWGVYKIIKQNTPATSEVKNSLNYHNLNSYELSHTTFCGPKRLEVKFEQLPAGIIADKGVKLCSKGHPIRMVLVSMEPDGNPLIARVTKSAYDSLQVGDKISHSSATESAKVEQCYCQIAKIDSVYKLPSGYVSRKACFKCNHDPKENHYIIEFGPLALFEHVSKDVWDKLKVGDKIPFKRPEY